MKYFKVVDHLLLKNGELLCKKPSGRSMQKAHFRQGDLDGACGVYSIAMLLNILGVFEAEEMNSNSDSDARYAEWKLINALNKYGLYREGLRSDEIQEILTKTYSKYVNVQVANKEDHDLIELVQNCIDKNIPTILGFNYDNKNGHWVVAVGYAVDENDNLTAILTLDPGNDSPKYSMWNGIIDLPKVPRKKYAYIYNSNQQSMVDIDEIIIITTKQAQ